MKGLVQDHTANKQSNPGSVAPESKFNLGILDACNLVHPKPMYLCICLLSHELAYPDIHGDFPQNYFVDSTDIMFVH